MSQLHLNDNPGAVTTTVELFNEHGKLLETRQVHNLITTVGKAHVADQLSETPGGTAMGYLASGTGTNAAAAGDTTLQTENARVALDSRTDSSNVVTYVGTFAAGTGTGSITEAGILNAASNGTLLCRAVFGAITKGASDTLVITWAITVS